MPAPNFRATENGIPIEEIDETMRLLSRFRKQRPTDQGQAEPLNGAVQYGPPNKPTHPPPTKPTKPIKRLREGLGNIWPFDATETRQASFTPNQFGPPNRPTKPPQPPRPQPKKAVDADGH